MIEHQRFLLCFGSQRGGTTWLAEQLRQHPDTDFPPRKELRYLDPVYVHDFNRIQKERVKEFRRRMWNSLGKDPQPLKSNLARELFWNARYALVAEGDYNDSWYASLFTSCNPTKLTGDFSPDYSLLPEEGVEHLARLVPQAKLLFMMRNPVDRTLSGSAYPLRHNKDLSPEEKEEFVRNTSQTQLQINFSDYRSIIERFERHFPAEQFHYAFHDDVTEDPQGLIAGICEFTGMEFKPEFFGELSKSVNRSPKVDSSDDLRRDLSRQYLDLLEWLRDRFGGHAVRWYDDAKDML